MATESADIPGIHDATWRALETGDALSGRRLAMRTLRWATARDDHHARAMAHLQLAHADLLESSFEPALIMSQKAGSELETLGDLARAVEAICISAYCAIGRAQTGQAQAYLAKAREMAQTLPVSEGGASARARVENYAGIAASWSCEYAQAREHFALSLSHLLCANDLAHTLQPMLNLWINQVLEQSCRAGQEDRSHPQPDHLQEMKQMCMGLRDAAAASAFSVAQMSTARAMLEFLCHHLSIHQSCHGEAQAYLQACRQRIRPMHAGSWMQILGWWAELRQAQVVGEARTARYCALSMLAAAQRTRHVPVQRLARRLAAPLLEKPDDPVIAPTL